jgi:SAM-dependent methyltransferase
MRLRIVDCTSCGLGRLHPRPRPELISQFYPASYYGVTGAKFVPLIEGLVRLVGARQVRALSRGLSEGARVLDVGCGRGVLLSALARRGFEAHGFEMSQAAATGVDRRAIVRIGTSLEEAHYPQRHFDQVILWHVLEHLPEPRRTLDEVRRILQPGGRLVVAVPNYSSLQARCCGAGWFHLDPPRHLFHFPVAALRQLVESVGFQINHEHHFSLRQNPFGWVQSVLNCVPELPRNGLYSLLKHRGDASAICGRVEQLELWTAYWLGMPAACVQSVVDAILRRGASVCIEAQSQAD